MEMCLTANTFSPDQLWKWQMLEISVKTFPNKFKYVWKKLICTYLDIHFFVKPNSLSSLFLILWQIEPYKEFTFNLLVVHLFIK